MSNLNSDETSTGQTTAPAQKPATPGKSTKKARVAPRKPHVAPTKAKSAKNASGAQKAPKSQKRAPAARQGSKKAEIIALLQKPKGASLAELMKTTGWQAHSVRGFISGTLGKKMGLKIESTKRDDGERVYSLSR